WLGRDAQTCTIARPDDVLISARHARLYRDTRGQWHAENNKSLNGLWLRITEPMPLGGACPFRLGEQRFLFRGPQCSSPSPSTAGRVGRPPSSTPAPWCASAATPTASCPCRGRPATPCRASTPASSWAPPAPPSPTPARATARCSTTTCWN